MKNYLNELARMKAEAEELARTHEEDCICGGVLEVEGTVSFDSGRPIETLAPMSDEQAAHHARIKACRFPHEDPRLIITPPRERESFARN